MKRNERMTRIEQCRNRLFAAITDGAVMGSEADSARLQKIKRSLDTAIEEAAFLDIKDDTLQRVELAEKFMTELKRDLQSYFDTFACMVGEMYGGVETTLEMPHFTAGAEKLVKYYFTEFASDETVQEWKDWFDDRPMV